MQLSGLASGMDTSAIVQTLVSTSIDPQKNAIYGRKQDNNAQISALGKIKSAMNALKSATEALKDSSDLNPTTATSSDESKIKVLNADTSFRGELSIDIQQKATAHSLSSALQTSANDDLGGGKLKIDSANGEHFELDIDPSKSSLNDIADAINNAADNFGVSASLIKHNDGEYRLMVTASNSGTDHEINIRVDDSDGDSGDGSGLSALTNAGNWDTTEAPQNAIIEFKGMRFERQSNIIDDALEGIELDIGGATVGDTVVVKIDTDSTGQKAAVDQFVKAYNNLQSVMSSQTGENAVLEGDGLARSLRSSMRSAIGEPNGSDGKFMFEIGLEVDRYGKATVDTSKLDEALKNDPDAIVNMFSGAGASSERILKAIDGFLDSKEGRIANRETSINNRQKSLDERLSALDRRATAYEARLRNQFSAMEQIISKFNTMGSFLGGLTAASNNSSG